MNRTVKLLGVLTLAAFVAVALAGRPGTPPVMAQQSETGEIQVLEQRVETNFPTNVTFHVTVAGPDEIEEVRVVMKTLGQTTRSAYRQVEFEPGRQVSGEAELLTGGNDYVPPGTRMAYSIEARDRAGRVHQTEEQVFVYLDSRFPWYTVSEDIVTVYYNDPMVEQRARHVLETALRSLAITGPLLGISPDVPLHIVTYHRYGDMVGALPFRSQATRSQLITQGMAFDEERVLLVHSGDGSVTGTTAHEFVHLLVGDAAGRAYPQVPAWLNEGLAEYGSYHGEEQRRVLNPRMAQAIFVGKVRPLWHLGAYNGTPEEIIYAYAQGESVVTFMVQEYGEERMTRLIPAITRTLDIDAALTEVYGLDQHGLDSAWRQEIGLEPLPRPEEGNRHALLENIPDATVAPVLMPTFPPLEPAVAGAGAAPVEPAPAAASQAPPAAREAAPASADSTAPEVAQPAPQLQSEAPTEAPAQVSAENPAEIPASSGSEAVEPPGPGAATPGGCSPPAAAGVFAGELGLLLLLAMPAGLVALRRRG